MLHLLHSRFWHKVLFDAGVVSTPNRSRSWCTRASCWEDNQKMSKSRGNVVNPDDMIDQFGADAVRLYEMFMGPLESMKPWSTRGVEGITRFLDRVWRLMVAEDGTLECGGDRCGADAGAAAVAALHHQEGDGRYRGAAIQHGHFADDGVYERDDQVGSAASRIMEPFVLLLLPFAPISVRSSGNVSVMRQARASSPGRSSIRHWSSAID